MTHRDAYRTGEPIGWPFRSMLAAQSMLTATLGLTDLPSLTRLIAVSGSATNDAIAQVMLLVMGLSAAVLLTQNLSRWMRLCRYAFLPFHTLSISYLVLASDTSDMRVSWPLTLYYLVVAGLSLYGSVAAREVRD